MRDAFLKSLTHLAKIDKDIVLLTADLGYGVFENFEKDFPGQFFNVGVAEQNMTGLASGLAIEGKKVVTYSIGNFPTLRCLEQIRNDACYHELNITIVASGGGFSYGSLGMSHHTTEDIAIMRSLPGTLVVAPGTQKETEDLTSALINHQGVSYLRLDKSFAKDMPHENIIGKANQYSMGVDITLVTTGGILKDVIEASELLKERNISCNVVSMHTIKPIDSDILIHLSNNSKGIVTVEEHNLDAGLGSAVAEVLLDYGAIPKIFLRIGLDNKFSSIVGSQDYLKEKYELDSISIARKVAELFKKDEKR